jgi:hypothetical protein
MTNVRCSPFFLLILIGVLLAGCASDQFRAEVSSDEMRDVAALPVLKMPFRKEGIDFWLKGVPSRKYTIIGVIDDRRRENPFMQKFFYRDIAELVREKGGDAAIDLVSEDSVETMIANDCHESPGSGNFCDDDSGASWSRFAPGNEETIYSLNRDATSAPLKYRDTHLLVIRYAD